MAEAAVLGGRSPARDHAEGQSAASGQPRVGCFDPVDGGPTEVRRLSKDGNGFVRESPHLNSAGWANRCLALIFTKDSPMRTIFMQLASKNKLLNPLLVPGLQSGRGLRVDSDQRLDLSGFLHDVFIFSALLRLHKLEMDTTNSDRFLQMSTHFAFFAFFPIAFSSD